MNVKEFQKILLEAGLPVPEDIVRKVQVGVMELYEKKNYHKAVMFKTGFLTTATALKNYDDNHEMLLEAFIQSNLERHPPQYNFSWQFGEHTVCIKLNQQLNCTVTGEPCDYHERKRYPLCELVYESLQEAAKSIRK
ncbi:MAG: hypothetical protein ACFFD4_08160 [Candidatus Odinarchaeota archaeon]